MIRLLNKDFSKVEERLYSTGNDELDELMERAFCDGYEYAQKEFNFLDTLANLSPEQIDSYKEKINEAGTKVGNVTKKTCDIFGDLYAKAGREAGELGGITRNVTEGISEYIPTIKKHAGNVRDFLNNKKKDYARFGRAISKRAQTIHS